MAAQLRLVTDETVVQFPAREPSSFDAAWACRTGMMRKRGDGSDKTRKLWERAAKKVGSARLLKALQAYLAEKEPTYGFCGLSVWLNGEKYDHWLPSDAEAALVETPPYPQRPALIASLGEPFVKSYLDSAEISEDGFVTPRTSYAEGKLMEQRQALKAAGLVGIRPKR